MTGIDVASPAGIEQRLDVVVHLLTAIVTKTPKAKD